MRKVSRNSEEKLWVARYKIQRSQAWHINAVLKKKSSCPNLRCSSPLVLPIPREHSSATHRSSERGTVFAAHVLQKRLLPLGRVKPGLLGLVCNNTISISFPSKTQKFYNRLGPILAFGLSFASKCIWILFFEGFF